MREAFIHNLGVATMLEHLRAPATEQKISWASAHASTIAEASREIFGAEPKMQLFCKVNNSVCVVLTASTSVDGGGLSTTPSNLKECIHNVTKLMEESSPLTLAFRYGEVGIEAMRRARSHISAGARVDVGAQRFNEALSALKNFDLKGSHAFNSDSVLPLIRDISSAVSLWGKTMREGMKPQVELAFHNIHAILNKMAEVVMASLENTFSPKVQSVIELVEAALPPADSEEGVSSALVDPSSLKAGSDDLEAFLEDWTSSVQSAWVDALAVAELAGKAQESVVGDLLKAPIAPAFDSNFNKLHEHMDLRRASATSSRS